MKKHILLFCIVLLGCQLFAQNTELTGEKRTAVVSAIEKAHKQMTSLSATFTQEKSSSMFTEKVIQKGKIFYKSPRQLRWEYTTPKSMAIIFSNGKVLLKNEKGTTNNPNKMLSEMGNMIMNTINGNLLQDNTNFQTKYYKNSKTGDYVVVLTPLNKRIKAYYKDITITLNAKTYLADKVVMNEVNGDSTAILFADKKTNGTLSDSLFK